MKIGRIGTFLAITALTALALGAPGAARAQPEEEVGMVRVVHGLRGLVADIYLDGELALPTFQPERSTDPLPIPAGDHVVEIRQAGAAASDTPLLTQTVTVPAGFQGSVVAHLGPDGKPVLTAYADDLSAVPAGQTRVVVRHAADAEPVSVLLDDSPTFPELSPNTEATEVVSAGDYQVAVTPVDDDQPLATPQGVEYADGTANFMYLIGSQQDATLGWAAVRVDDLSTAPAIIQTGDGSTEPGAAGGGSDALALIAVGAGVAVLAATGVRAHRAAPPADAWVGGPRPG